MQSILVIYLVESQTADVEQQILIIWLILEATLERDIIVWQSSFIQPKICSTATVKFLFFFLELKFRILEADSLLYKHVANISAPVDFDCAVAR